MPKVVLDSGVLVSAFLTPNGVSAEILRHAKNEQFRLYLCEEILQEVERVLFKYPHIRKRFQYSNRQATMYCQGLRDAAYLVAKLPSVKVVIGDPNDDMVVACALKARASYVVTRDEMILKLKKYKGIKMVTPEELMEILKMK